MPDCPLCRIPRFLMKPREAFQEARNEPLSTAAFTVIPLILVFAVLVTGLGTLLSPAIVFGPMAPLITGSGLLRSGTALAALLVGILLIAILCLIAIVVKAAWLHLWVFALGGRLGLEQTGKAVLYAAIPILLLGWIPLIGLLAGALWAIVILITGIEVLHGISSGRALAAVFLAWFIGFLLFVVLPLLFFLPVRVVGPVPVE
ncbi:MAG: YIP1 family protein [Methanomicrobiales archaeon]|nr:YIP1 family protein [Methanomicrobiales archaeon]